MSEILKEEQQNYLDSLLVPSAGLIAEMEEFAAEKGIPILDKHASAFLELLVKIKKPKAVLEIGTAIGYSTIRIAALLEDGTSIDTIEKSSPNIKLARANFRRSGLEQKINLIEGDALDLLKTHQKNYDLIFLDADKEDYKNLFDLSVPRMNDGGMMIIDNLLWHGYAASDEVPEKFKRSAQFIKDFNLYFLSYKGLSSGILPIGDGLGVAIRG